MRMRTIAVAIAALAVTTTTVLAGDNETLSAQARRMDGASSPGQTAVSGRIAADFSGFAGSTQNADSLAQGLRNGTPVTLTGNAPSDTVVFDPPTRPMGNGNVFITMALAKQQLASYGITNPTPSELQAAMTGGTITAANGQTVQLQGVLTMRASGMGWGQIAHATGTQLGPVISGIKAANRSLPSNVSTTTHVSNAGAGSAGKSGSRITTAAGVPSGSAHGYQGSGRGSGIVTAAGAPAGGYGGVQGGAGFHSGIVTAAGASAAAQSHGNAGLGHGKNF
jgi:hypothetical protein